jgi:hypothetical protein
MYLILRLFTTSNPFNDNSGNLIELINGILIVCKEIYLLTHLNLVYRVRLTFEKKTVDYGQSRRGLKDNCNEKFISYPKKYNFDQ